MLYLIGLGLEPLDISLKALEVCKKCKKIYLEKYTSPFPYDVNKLKKIIGKEIFVLDREKVESEFLIKEAKKKKVALLVYGDPLVATTHFALVREAKREKVKVKILHNTSVVNAITEVGLFLYKFGKITSIPKWEENYRPESFFDVIKENLSIKAHTLLLVDPQLELEEALRELKEVDKENLLEKKQVIVCSAIGTKHKKIFVGEIQDLMKKKAKKPFCLIVPAELSYGETIESSENSI